MISLATTLVIVQDAAPGYDPARLYATLAFMFVVVGAAHLVGDDSLVVMLRKKGYTVEQQ